MSYDYNTFIKIIKNNRNIFMNIKDYNYLIQLILKNKQSPLIDLCTSDNPVHHGLYSQFLGCYIWVSKTLPSPSQIRLAALDLEWTAPIPIKLAANSSIKQINNLTAFV